LTPNQSTGDHPQHHTHIHIHLDYQNCQSSHLVPSIFRRHPINQLQSQYKVATCVILR
ncbi:hypothetical protein CTAM01_01243, partial [Colletotrichum tamarilloi]